MPVISYSAKIKYSNSQSFTFKRLTSGKPYLLWWYGAAVKSNNPRQQDLQVIFREILKSSAQGLELGSIQKEHLPIPLLASYRIGTIWRDGKSAEEIDYPIAEFQISFAADQWRHKSFNAQTKAGLTDDPYPVELYPLPYAEHDRSPILEFDLANGGKLLLNSMDFFRAAYGYSVELKRVLTTYPFKHVAQSQESILNLLLPDIPHGPYTNGWEVLQPSHKFVQHDAVFLAHLKHDTNTQKVVKKLANSIVKGMIETAGYQGGAYSFLAVEPWHGDQDVSIRVRGIPLGDSFLGLQILGISDPHGVDVAWLKKNAMNAQSGSKGGGASIIRRQSSPSEIPIASTFAPAWDGDEAIMPIRAQSVGNQRQVQTVTGQSAPAGQVVVVGSPAGSYGSAPAQGSGQGVGGLVTKVVIERPPRFELMWQEAQVMRQQGQLSKVEWYDGTAFHSSPPIGSIAMDDKGKAAHVTQAFVMRLTQADGRAFVCVELAGRNGREIFTGLMAEIETSKPVQVWIRWILHEAARNAGVFRKYAKKSIYKNFKVYKHGEDGHATLARVLGELE